MDHDVAATDGLVESVVVDNYLNAIFVSDLDAEGASLGNQLCYFSQHGILFFDGNPSCLAAMNAPGQRQARLW